MVIFLLCFSVFGRSKSYNECASYVLLGLFLDLSIYPSIYLSAQEGEEVDYKKAAGFAQHMKKSEAMSHFSKTKTMTEQREFLPIFQVKEDLLRVIRDNQVYMCVCAPLFFEQSAGFVVATYNTGQMTKNSYFRVGLKTFLYSLNQNMSLLYLIWRN